MDTGQDETYESKRSSRMLIIVLLLVLIGSPGSLLLFTIPAEVTPVLLLLVIPLTLFFVLWYRRLLAHREQFRKDGLVP